MFYWPHKTVASLVLATACLAGPSALRAITPVKLSGAIAGRVTDSGGTPRLGATVLLYNRQERVFSKALTDSRGEFAFTGLFPDLYSIRVTLAAFIPALKKDILVQPGMRSVLAVNLNTLFSSIQLAYPPVENGSFMTDDFKWALRGSIASRPVLRLREAGLERKDPRSRSHAAVFSETRGIVRVSGGDAPVTNIASEADLGAAFALATSLYGNNTLEVSGNVGVGSQTGLPVAAFRTGYARNEAGGGPEVSVTVRQLSMPGRYGVGAPGADAVLSTLRSMAASFDDRTQITDDLSMQYGTTVDSVTFRDRMNYLSPYMRLRYSPDAATELAFAYTSGNARPDLAGSGPGESGLQRSLNTLGWFPRMSLRDGRPRVQRGEEYELTYKRRAGSREYEVSVYNETVKDAAVTMVAPDGMYAANEVLPDLFSGNSVFNAGNFGGAGYSGSITQNAGHVSATLSYGTMAALTVADHELVSHSPDELRAMIRAGRKRALTARLAATSPWSGTYAVASYQWADSRWVSPGHLYTTESTRPMPGLNVYLRQPIPFISGRPCRVELTADLRNLLAQGYVPLAIASGQSVLLVETPRSFRGGVNFIF